MRSSKIHNNVTKSEGKNKKQKNRLNYKKIKMAGLIQIQTISLKT